MFCDGQRPTPSHVRPADLLGSYALYDDGWPRRLTVGLDPEGRLEASFHSYRPGGPPDYEASIELGGTAPHQVTLIVRSFNELPQQVFRGWFFNGTRNGFAGVTDWKGIPFGFYARRTRPLALHVPIDRPVSITDLTGWYTMCCDGGRATVRLDSNGPSTVRGELKEPGDHPPLVVTGEVQFADSPKLTMAIHGVPGAVAPVIFEGFLFGRPRNAIAGEVQWDGVTLGCYLSRFAGHG